MYTSVQLELEELVGAVLEKGASDLFLIAGKSPVLKVQNEYFEVTDKQPLDRDSLQGIFDSMASEEQKKKFSKDLRLDLSYEYKDIARFRVNAYRQRGSVSLVLRYIPKTVPPVEDLNLPNTIKSFTTIPKGLVLFVSPAGSGKTTTIASLLDFINHTQQKHIITIEDPIEYLIKSDRSFCEQMEVGEDTIDAIQGLQSVMHASADVVMVSRLDSPEKIEKAIMVAETGHLVFATMNTSYAMETINWIVDLYPTSRQVEMQTRLAAVLSGIVTQQLVPTVDERLMPAVEILIANQAVKHLIREGKSYQLDDVIATGVGEGMLSLDRSLVELVKNGVVAKEEAINHVKDIPTFESLLQN